jgi:hypothetical protein
MEEIQADPKMGLLPLRPINLLLLLQQVRLFHRAHTAWKRVLRWFFGRPNPLLPTCAVWKHGALFEPCTVSIDYRIGRVSSNRALLKKALRVEGDIQKQIKQLARAAKLWLWLSIVSVGLLTLMLVILVVLSTGVILPILAIVFALSVISVIGIKCDSVVHARNEYIDIQQEFYGKIPDEIEDEIHLFEKGGLKAVLISCGAHWGWTAGSVGSDRERLLVYLDSDNNPWYRGRFDLE